MFENNDCELERFKTDINLVDYAVAHGYEVDSRDSSKSSVVMRHSDGDKIVVTTNPNGHGAYFNIRDDHDSGTIVDFVQQRLKLNLGQIRKELRPWLTSPTILHRSNASQNTNSQVRPTPSSKDRQGVSSKLAQMGEAGAHPFLLRRGLSLETLRDSRFVSVVRVDNRGNAVFPHRDRQGWCGAEIKNDAFSGFIRGGQKGLWVTNGIGKAKNLVIAESALDAISHAQTCNDKTIGYVSIGGSLSQHQRDLLSGLLFKAQIRGVTVAVGTDRDQAGHILANEISALAPKGMELERLIPTMGKDWNDDRKRSRGDMRWP